MKIISLSSELLWPSLLRLLSASALVLGMTVEKTVGCEVGAVVVGMSVGCEVLGGSVGENVTPALVGVRVDGAEVGGVVVGTDEVGDIDGSHGPSSCCRDAHAPHPLRYRESTWPPLIVDIRSPELDHIPFTCGYIDGRYWGGRNGHPGGGLTGHV